MSTVGRVRVAAGVAAFYVVFLIAESAAKCNNVLVADCLNSLSKPNSQPNKFIYTKEERQGYCQDLQGFLSCLEETGCQHLQAVEPVYEGFKNALNFTCSEENHQHEQLATCWEWNGFQDAQQFCYANYGNRSEEVPKCEDRNNAISCIVSSVDKCCGKESAAYVKKSATLLLEPSFTTTNCELNLDEEVVSIETCSSLSSSSGLSGSSGPNVGLIVVIVFVIIVVVVVVVVVVIIVRKSGSRQWLSM